MKQIALFILFVALFAVCASALQVSSPTFGTATQDRVVNVQTSVTITNNNTATMTNIAVNFGNGAENVKYLLTASGVPQSLAAGAQASITVNGTVPLDHPAVDATSLDALALKIGTVTVTGTVNNNADSATSDVLMQAVNQLAIKKVRIECGDKSQSLDDGDRVKNLKPGTDCTLEVQVENNFDDSDRNSQKIGDIEFDSVDITLDSSNGDVDLDEGDDISDLSADSDDAITADVEIDEEADDGAVAIDVRVSGRDENGALHGEALSFKLDITRLTHDLQITRIELSPSAVTVCENSNIKVSVGILNQGKRNEDEAAVEISVPDLKFIKKIDNIELDKDDSTTVSFDVPVAKNSKEGVMRVDLKTYFDTLAPSNSGSAELTVSACEEDITEVLNQTSVVVPQVEPVVIPSGQAQAAPKKTTTTSFTDSPAYVALLAVLCVLIAGGIAALVVFIVRRKK